MSPEQIREPKDAGAKSDVYSSGVVLYEMLTGQLPFNSRSLPKLIDAIYRGEKQPPSALRPEIDKELERSCSSRCTRAWISATRPRASSTKRSRSTTPGSRSRRPDVIPSPISDTHADAVPAMDVPHHWALVNVKPEANEKHAIIGDSVMVGRDRTCSIVLAAPGRLAPACADHAGGQVTAARGPAVREWNVRQQRAGRPGRPQAGRHRAVRRGSGLQLCARSLSSVCQVMCEPSTGTDE